MVKKVLVAYASKYGSTTEIAERVGEVLREEGLEVDLLPVKQVKDPVPYNAVVLGTAAYMFQWRKDATKFLRKHEEALAKMPVWLFMSGPLNEGDPVAQLEGKIVPNGIKPVVDSIKPVDLAVFHGVVNYDKMNFFEKWVMNKMKASKEDYRDWEGISAWAKAIAGKVKG